MRRNFQAPVKRHPRRRWVAVSWVETFPNPAVQPRQELALVTLYRDQPERMYWGLDGTTFRNLPPGMAILAEWTARDSRHDTVELDYLRRFRAPAVTRPEEYAIAAPSCGWISPTGEFFTCAYGDHESLARCITAARFKSLEGGARIERSWIKVDRRHGVTNPYELDAFTQAQLDTLADLATHGDATWQKELQRWLRVLAELKDEQEGAR